MPTQTITSADTSINQVPAIFKLLNDCLERPAHFWALTAREVLDYGGGKYDRLSEKLAELGVRNWIYDPFNRSDEHNALVRRMLTIKPADVAFCSNVLCVIKSPKDRREVLRDIKRMTDPDGYVFFTVYEGNGSSHGRRTTKGWQANRPLKSYIREIRREFRTGDFIGRDNKILRVEGFCER